MTEKIENIFPLKTNLVCRTISYLSLYLPDSLIMNIGQLNAGIIDESDQMNDQTHLFILILSD